MLETQVEHVLVVPTQVFHRLGQFQGFSPEADRYLAELLRPEHISYRPRHEVEEDPSYKQLIPYVVFYHRDDQGRWSVFEYTRGKGQGEGRLHSKRSIGIGGHISLVDVDRPQGEHPYEEGLRRELNEEVRIETPYQMRRAGLINDDLTPVGRVHLGVVHLCQVERPAVESRESDILSAGFRPLEELLADLTGFETWSSICLESLLARL